MHIKIKIGVLVCLTLAVASCASVPRYQPVPSASSVSYSIGPARLFAKLDYMHRFLDENRSVIYFQNHGGGGVATGLLFGPIGVAANVAMIRAQTEKDAKALSGKLPVDVGDAFSRAAKAASLPLAKEPGSAILSPYLLVKSVDESHIRFAALLIADFGSPSGEETRQYTYEMPDVYPESQLAAGLNAHELAALAADLTAGFAWDVGMLGQDARGRLKPGAKGTIRSSFITPRFLIPLSGYRLDAGAGRVGFITVAAHESAFYSLASDAATVSN